VFGVQPRLSDDVGGGNLLTLAYQHLARYREKAFTPDLGEGEDMDNGR
jgi:hypothetical protein